jgi:hypothetical protein
LASATLSGGLVDSAAIQWPELHLRAFKTGNDLGMHHRGS